MGHFIDRLALISLTAGALFAFFIGASHSVPLSAGAAFFAMALIKRIAGSFPKNPLSAKRRGMKSATRHLTELALGDENRARDEISKLISLEWSKDVARSDIALIMSHPAAENIPADKIMEKWREHHGRERLIIACLGNVSSAALRLSGELKSPCVRVVDFRNLTEILAGHPEMIPESVDKRPSRPLMRGIFSRMRFAASGKTALSAACMFAIYLITGNLSYLAASAILGYISIISVISRGRPRELFRDTP